MGSRAWLSPATPESLRKLGRKPLHQFFVIVRYVLKMRSTRSRSRCRSRCVWRSGRSMKIFPFEVCVAVYIRNEIHAFRKGDVLSVHYGNHDTRSGAGALALAPGAQNRLLIVR